MTVTNQKNRTQLHDPNQRREYVETRPYEQKPLLNCHMTIAAQEKLQQPRPHREN